MPTYQMNTKLRDIYQTVLWPRCLCE